MRTKLNVFPVVDDSKVYLNMRNTFIKRQTKSKEYTDRKKGSVDSDIQTRGIMCEQRMLVSTGTSKYIDPQLIQEKIGVSTVVLRDGGKNAQMS